MTDEKWDDDLEIAPVPSNTIVVGHDGSQGAAGSLELALELAEKLGAPVVVMRSWTIKTGPRAADYQFGFVSSSSEISKVVHDDLVKDCRDAVHRRPAVSVSYRALLAQPADALVKLSTGARMLVVGSRGLGGFASLLLGSISEQCVRHAKCPVLVVRPGPAGE